MLTTRIMLQQPCTMFVIAADIPSALQKISVICKDNAKIQRAHEREKNKLN